MSLKVGNWTISKDSPPVPVDVFSATHEDYDGPEHRGHKWVGYKIGADSLTKLRALRGLLDELIGYEEEEVEREETRKAKGTA